MDGWDLFLLFLKLVVVLFSKLGLERRNLAELRKVLPDFERTVSLFPVLTQNYPEISPKRVFCGEIFGHVSFTRSVLQRVRG